MTGQRLFLWRCHVADLLQHLLRRTGNGEQVGGGGIGEAGGDDGINQPQQRRPVAIDVEEDDRRIVQPSCRQVISSMSLLKGAHPARQNDEGVRHLEHLPLAVVHAVGDHQIGELSVADFVAN